MEDTVKPTRLIYWLGAVTLDYYFLLRGFWTQRATERQRTTEEQPIQVVSFKL
jgi:hypothetical protein